FVREQADALREEGIDVELFSFPAGSRQYLPAVVAIRRRLRRESFDLVHAHFGLAGWCASLAGARPLAVTFHGTDVRHRVSGFLSRRLVGRLDLIAPASRALLAPEGGRPALPSRLGSTAILPTGANLERFLPAPRAEARERIGLDSDGRCLLFPAARSRPGQRSDRPLALPRTLERERPTVAR